MNDKQKEWLRNTKTIRVEKPVHRRLRIKSVTEGKTMTEVLNELVPEIKENK